MADLRQRRASSAVTDPLHTDSPNVTATTDAPRCPLGFSGAPPPGHPPVDAASGARCPFGFSSSAPAAAPAAAPRLLSVAEVPAWMRDNDFIETLYRPQLSSAILCVRSGFLWLTNETVNVWTHFVASLFFAALAALLCARTGMWTPSALPYYVRHLAAAAASAADAQPLDAAALRALSAEWRARGAAAALRVANLAPDALARVARPLLAELRVGTLPLLLTATFCTAASTAFHVFSCYSPRALRIFAQLDFVGIALLCGGHAVSGVFYGFYCAPRIANYYYAFVCIALFLALSAIFSNSFHSPASRVYRAVVFSFLGASNVIPVAHAGFLHDWKHDSYPLFASYMVAAGLCYFAGAIFYASRLPECCRPGKHDRFWASHQLLHIFVIAGSCLHAYGCHVLLLYRVEQGCAASPFM